MGCTSPQICYSDTILYLGDGRFHLESAMIANPKCRAFRYDPYEKKLTEETYDHKRMLENRLRSIDQAKNSKTFGLILGTLGRQGNPNVLKPLLNRITTNDKDYVVILLSEIFPTKLRLFMNIDSFMQVQCCFFFFSFCCFHFESNIFKCVW